MQRRSIGIDITKGILTVGMVFTHVNAFLSNNNSMMLKGLIILTDLVSFSGFLFCFGFASWSAYLSKPSIPWKSAIRTAFKCYLAFVTSGVAFRVLVDRENLSPRVIMRVSLLRDVPGFSEFLLAFSIVTLFGCIMAPVIRAATNSVKNLLVAMAVCIFVTFFPARTSLDPLIGLFIGSSDYSYYPVIQYFPLFLLGVFAARTEIVPQVKLFLVGSAGTIAFLVLDSIDIIKIIINRFPPSLLWILGSICAVVAYYGIAHFIALSSHTWLAKYLNAVGSNVLLYLLASNLVLFVLKALRVSGSHDLKDVVITYCAMMAFIFFIQAIVVDLHRSDSSLKSNAT